MGSVILEIPEHPVDEGEALTLHCRTETPYFNRTYFYKDQHLIGSSSTGNLTIQKVTKSSEGDYTCGSSAEESLSRRLTVTGERFCDLLQFQGSWSFCRSNPGLVTGLLLFPAFLSLFEFRPSCGVLCLEARPSERPPSPTAYILFPVVGACLLLIVLTLLCLWRNRKG